MSNDGRPDAALDLVTCPADPSDSTAMSRPRLALALVALAVMLAALPAGAARSPRLAPEDTTVWRHATWRPPYRDWLDQQRFALADSVARAALARASAAPRPDSVTLAALALDAAETAIYANLAREPRTLDLARRALATFERTPGRDSLALARALFVTGEVHRRRRELAPAGAAFDRGGAIRERHLAPDDVDLAGALAMRSTIILMERRAGSRPLLERAYAIRRQRFGPDHFRTLQLLQNIAIARREDGDLAGVADAFETAARGFDRLFGPVSNDAVRSWTNVGLAAKDLGDFRRATAAFDRALAGLERQSYPDTVIWTQTLSSYAEMHLDVGDVESARPLIERDYALTLRYFPRDDRSTTETQYSLARLLFLSGETSRATAYLDSSMAHEFARRPDSTGLAPAVYNQARVRRALRDTSAVSWMRRAWRLWTANGTRPHDAYVALVQSDWAGALCDAGRAAEALPLLREAVAWADSLHGPEHPQTLGALAELARAEIATGDPAAHATARRLATGRRANLRTTSAGFAERQALLWSSRAGLGLDPLVQLAVHPGATPALRADALDALARVRGLVLETMAARVRRDARRTTPEVAALADSLRRARERSAAALVRAGGADATGQRAARLDAERHERALAALAPAWADAPDSGVVGALAASLARDEALVSYARFEDGGIGSAPRTRVAAFVLRRGATPLAFDLGDAARVDADVDAWRAAMRSGLDPRAGTVAERAAVRAGAALRARIWDPLERSLAGVARVRVVPEGSLALVDFAALPARAGGWLAERGPLLARISRERDLLRADEPAAGEALLAVGGVDFEHADDAVPLAASAFRGAAPTCAAFRDVRFAPLPGAEREAKRVMELWRASGREGGHLLQGATADERAFKKLAPTATRLHLATHGFVLAPGCAGEAAGARGIGGLAPSAPESRPVTLDLLSHPTSTFTRTSPASAANPLRLAGLALAGANARETRGPDDEDGVLTAEEIASLDLSRVRDVVLSACDTGLGQLADGEGVLGLERAFRTAGAANLVLSLWPIADDATAAWMERYWRERLDSSAEPAAAVRAASLARLAELRRTGASTHPARWAGFVASGAGH